MSAGGRVVRLLCLLAFVPALLLLARCAPAGDAPPATRSEADAPSTAANAMIENAKTPEERRALEKARDEVDARMREKVRALDAEIERLRKENESLRQQAGR